MEKPTQPTRTIGTRSAQLLSKLQQTGKNIFTFHEALTLTDTNYYATANLLTNMVKRGILTRIKRGIYLIMVIGSENTQLKNWPIIARELAGKDLYYISYYSAMRIHGMTSHPLFDVYLTLPTRKKDKKLSDVTYHFIYSKKEHFWGMMTHWATKQEQVRVSDLERTIMDGLDQPGLSGGITEVARGIWAKQKNISLEKIGQYAKKFKTKAAIKRLGFILELFNFENSWTSLLTETIAGSKDYIFLDPDGAKDGKYLSRWRVCVNTNVEELKASV